jgi:N-acetylglucosamine kinase-like BadF-type ATPase
MYGKDYQGNILRVGGMGRILGDEGSGYSIGRKGLNAFSKEYDGRAGKTKLTKILEAEFDITDQTDLINKVYKQNLDIASVAPYVIKAAEEKDPVCLDILEKECEELSLHVRAMKQKLKLKVMNLCLIGSLLTSENLYSKMFKEKISILFDNIIIKDPEFPPEMGAVILADKYTYK